MAEERNYPTQAVIQWLDVDEDTHKHYIDMAYRAYGMTTFYPEATEKLAEMIEHEVEK